MGTTLRSGDPNNDFSDVRVGGETSLSIDYYEEFLARLTALTQSLPS